MEIKSPEDLQKFLEEQNAAYRMEKSAIMEGYELAKAKLAKAENDYRALAEMHNRVIEDNKKLKADLAEATKKPAPKKRATKTKK